MNPEVAAHASSWASDEIDQRIEIVVIGNCLDDPKRIATARAILEPSHFSAKRHEIVFDALCAMSESGVAIDPLTVLTYLRDHGLLEKAGGSVYVAGSWFDAMVNEEALTLVNAPYITHFAKWCRTIRERAQIREVVDQSKRTVAQGQGNVGSPIDYITTAAERLAQIARESREIEISDSRSGIGEAYHRVANPKEKYGIETGIKDLNEVTGGLYPGDLTVIAARPSVGKSALGLSLMLDAVLRYGHKGIGAAFYSLEMPRSDVYVRLACSLAGVPTQIAMGRAKDAEGRAHRLSASAMANFTAACRVLEGRKFWIDHAPGLTIAKLDAHIQGLKAEYDKTDDAGNQERRVALVFVDYLGLMRGKGENRVQQVSAISSGLKELALKHNVAMVALAQLNREVEKRGDENKLSKPQLADLRDSGSIEQDADNVWMIHREHKDKAGHGEEAVEILIRKQRNGETRAVSTTFFRRCILYADRLHDLDALDAA